LIAPASSPQFSGEKAAQSISPHVVLRTQGTHSAESIDRAQP